jgi:alkanesulfonate monooxygenase SsuD/methylene tetrahydromethanopterin reductase-like flavin-dependent oxidoreductase (luciferase family)
MPLGRGLGLGGTPASLADPPPNQIVRAREYKRAVPFSLGVVMRLRPGGATALTTLSATASLLVEAGAEALFLPPPQAHGDHDPYVTLAALSSASVGAALGSFGTPLDERPPALLAKIATGLDVCTGGRALLLVAAGSMAGDAAAESLEVLRAMLRVPGPSLSGVHLHIGEAWNEPKAQREGAQPLGVLLTPDAGSSFQTELLAIAARYADFCVLDAGAVALGTPTDLVEALAEASRRAGRVPGQLRAAAAVALRATTSVEALVEDAVRLRQAGFGAIVVDGEPELRPDAAAGAVAACATALGMTA